MPATNHLINEKSPYLQQHAYDPVDWHPWGEEAFQEAAGRGVPVFLSIGYSSCHWCHVMHEESFQKQEVAAILNRDFLAVKVDREERPDIDNIYMAVCQALNGQGGWPLTIIMTPDRMPFFAATYLPITSRRGMPGLLELLPEVKKLWDQERPALLETGKRVSAWLNAPRTIEKREDDDRELLRRAFYYFKQNFDPQYGGFGSAPKFPAPHNLYFLLRYFYYFNEPEARDMAEKTLEGMYRGGTYDHLGFGFARYSTDRFWLVPHFEKMLYDNALLALAYLEGYQVTGKHLYQKIAREIFTYLLRDMRSPEGGFYSAEDADSPEGEGAFYLWTPDQVRAVLGEKSDLFCSVYGIDQKGNFEGASIPNLLRGLPGGSQEEVLASMRGRLLQERNKRPRPARDDKILCGWNGLVIAALAVGARILQEPFYLQAALKALDFIMNRMRNSEGRLLARFREGEARYPAYAGDYAFLIWACIELYETSYDAEILEIAGSLNDDLIKYFWDESSAGFFFYGWDGEQLIGRPKEIHDGAVPSANSVAALNLLRLGRLIGREDLEEKGRKQLEYFAGQVDDAAGACSFYLCALLHHIAPGAEVVIVGSREADETRLMLKEISTGFRPFLLSVFKEQHEDDEGKRSLTYIRDLHSIDGRTTAYLCSGYACRPPAASVSELSRLLTTV